MSKPRTRAIRLDIGKVKETRQARHTDGKNVGGVREVELVDGRVMYRCADCLLLWPTPSPAARHRATDLPHKAGGTMAPLADEGLSELDMYTSSAAMPGSAVVPSDAVPRAVRAPKRPREVDRESFLDANAEDIRVSMTDFLDALIVSRTAARTEAAEQRDIADRLVREKEDMRKVLLQMRSMIDRVLGPTEQDTE